MPTPIADAAARLRTLRGRDDPISEASREVLPYSRRIGDALGALRAIVTDNTPTEQLDSDLQVVHGIVAALVGPEKADILIGKLPAIRETIATDVAAAFDRDPSATSYGEIIAAFPSILAVSTHRIAHAFYEVGERVVARIMAEEAHQQTGIDLHPGANIGGYFFIDHGTGVVIGESCILGDRVKLYHGVTLGAFSNRGGRRDVGCKRHPTLENDVTIYPNATILGGETVVGRGSVVGGNVWLTESVPPYTQVTMESPKLVVHQSPPPELGDGI
jgi:serine O-acetyltransferase